MKVFLSWSGSRSRAVAELLREWIKCVLQGAKPWISSRDLDRGSVWFAEINAQLKDTTVGVICLTSDNKNKPWILFEAGALAKGLSASRVCTFLIDLKPEDVEDPLAQFNHTMPIRESLFALVETLNTAMGDLALDHIILDKVFNTYWPQFETGFAAVIKKHPAEEVAPPRDDKDILAEILNLSRSLSTRVARLETTRQPIRVSATKASSNDESGRQSARYLMHYVRRYLGSGLDGEAVMDRLASRGFDPRLIAEAISEYYTRQKEREENSTKA